MALRTERTRIDLVARGLLLGMLAFPGCDSSPTTTHTEVPAHLIDIEELAEASYDKALVGDFAAVADNATSMDEAWRAYRPQAEEGGAAADDLTAMDAAVEELATAAASPVDMPTVARAANRVSGPMDELFGLYEPVVPPAVLELDYLGREVVLDAMEGDFAAATDDIDTIAARWAELRDEVVGAGGSAAADEYEASIAITRDDVAAEDADKLITDANVGLEVVDAIEVVFEG